MTNKTELVTKLDQIIIEADQQTQLYESSVQKLYITLGNVYLWWREAKKYDGFLDELYYSRGLVQYGQEEKFTRLVRLVWQIDWDGTFAPKLQKWAKALRSLHHEYETNKDAYSVDNPVQRIQQFFSDMGGIVAVGHLVSPLQQSDEDLAQSGAKRPTPRTKSELDLLSEGKIRSRHIELGEKYFATHPVRHKSIALIDSHIRFSRKGYAVALIKKTSSGHIDLIRVTNNEKIVHDTIIETYKRNEDNIPNILRILTEAVRSQLLPRQFEKHRSTLGELTDVLGSDGKTRLRSVKRLLLRPRTKDILISECRTDCSVVSISKPHRFPTNISKDVTLRGVNHKFIEQQMLQSRDLSFYTTETSKLEELDGQVLKANYRLSTKNTVSGRIHNLYFYNLSTQNAGSRVQADLNLSSLGYPEWRATVNRSWIEDLDSICVSKWIEEFGARLTRDRNKLVSLSLSDRIELSYDGKSGHYTKTESNIPPPTSCESSTKLRLHFRSKDIFLVLSSLIEQDIVGNVELAANEHVFTIYYHTQHASFLTAVPTCSIKGKLDRTAFKSYKE